MRTLMIRRPRNKAEGVFFDWACENGWIPAKRGWPDFFCIGALGDLMAVEVKPHNNRKLSPWQRIVMSKLSRLGVECYRWDPVTDKLTSYKESHPAHRVVVRDNNLREKPWFLGMIREQK